MITTSKILIEIKQTRSSQNVLKEKRKNSFIIRKLIINTKKVLFWVHLTN